MEVFFLIAVIGLYLLPYFVAKSRGHGNDLAILVVNVLLGWMFVGWVAALAWACTHQAKGA
jgi:RsiW-degrading membrane proteinase PrsW (M82 family)